MLKNDWVGLALLRRIVMHLCMYFINVFDIIVIFMVVFHLHSIRAVFHFLQSLSTE